jgi:hypothetical protein
MGQTRNSYEFSDGKPEGKRPGCRWESKIKMDGKEVVSL